MTHNVAKDLRFEGPTCPRCAELCPRNAIVCTDCGCRLGVDDETLKRWCRVRAATHTNRIVDADEHANHIVADIAQRVGAQPWPRTAK